MHYVVIVNNVDIVDIIVDVVDIIVDVVDIVDI